VSRRVLSGATLIDGTGGAPRVASVWVEGDKVLQIGEGGAAVPAGGDEVLDLSGKYLIPGIIDCHVHMCSAASAFSGPALATESGAAVSGALNAVRALNAGVTTVRDCGSPYAAAIRVRDMIDGGYIPGPRVSASGLALAMTGGHGVHEPVSISFEVDSPDEARKAVRKMRKLGANCIKLMANGLSVNSPELTEAEMRAAVDAAHDADMKVACHASVWPAVERAVAAGVDSIDHGFTLSDAVVERMLKQGTMVVATFNAILGIIKDGGKNPYWAAHLPVIRHRVAMATESFQKAYRAGVPFAMGTDASSRPLAVLGEVAPEFEALRTVGLTPMEAIQAGTMNAAKLLGWEKRIGSIEPGKLADIVVLNRNPLEDLSAIADVHMVIKGGVTVSLNGRLVA
jgi:imidazolonepropionase-like amidohydrolase